MLDVIADFLVPIMAKEPVLFSSKLYLLLLKQADDTNNNKVIHEMLACVDGVLTAEKWNKREEQISLKFDTLALFAKTATSEHLILWTIETLVKSWSDSMLSVDDFSIILLSLNISCCDPLLVYSSLAGVGNVSELEQMICKFTHKNLMRRMVVGLEELGVAKALFDNLQSENVRLKLIVDKHAEIIRCAEEEEEEQKRLEEERRRIQEEKKLEEERQRLLPSYRSNPLSFIVNNPNNFFNVCGSKVKFLSETRGSNLTLCNHDLRVEKTGDCWPNSFIAINRPPTGRVVLTGNNVFNSFIGVFNPSETQGCDPYNHMSGIQVISNCFYVRLRGSQSNRTNTKITRVEVEFTQSNFKITLPQANWSRDYNYEEGWVFGLCVVNGESWSLE
ncbi:hypothetical protein RCL1_008108 [Eukaryota sp. TZLM3-RCL]